VPLRWLRHAPRQSLNRFQLRQIQRLRQASRRTRIVAVACLAAALFLAVFPFASGRTTPRWYQLEVAKLALDNATDEGAEGWAPDAMREARFVLRTGMVEHRHQELRFMPLRNFTLAETILRDAEAKGRRAATLAQERRRGERNASQEAISRAAQAVGRSVSYSRILNLGSYDRRLLQKSKLRLEEAELLQRYGKFGLAAERARSATTHATQVSDHVALAASRYQNQGLIRSWRRNIDETIAWSRRTGAPAILVFKERHQLWLYDDGKPVKLYAAEMGYNSLGDKARAGDAATPEGRYRITAKKPVGQSTFHMALLLDYPNAEDRARFAADRRAGRISKRASLGGLIEIHGEGGRGKDWTKGCVALSNDDMKDLFVRVFVGTPVTIVGGDGNGGTFTKLMDMHRGTNDARID
jgi:hypothetical protein